MFGAIKKKLVDFGILEKEEEELEEVNSVLKSKETPVKDMKEPKDLRETRESVSAPKKGKIVNIHTTTQLKVVVVQPVAFEDSKEIADHLKTKKPVVVNMEQTDPEMIRRMIDFISGVVYAIDGGIQKISKVILLVTPYNVEITGDLQDELRSKGLFPWE